MATFSKSRVLRKGNSMTPYTLTLAHGLHATTAEDDLGHVTVHVTGESNGPRLICLLTGMGLGSIVTCGWWITITEVLR